MTNEETKCSFCKLKNERIITETKYSIAFYDAYPVTNGHTLVIPKRHIQSIFDMNEEELEDFWIFVFKMRKWLYEETKCSGMNIGINDGKSAGQTIMHGHLHLIPRRIGDVPDPRGGIRWIISDKANYWKIHY